jgi:hypothetical protein
MCHQRYVYVTCQAVAAPVVQGLLDSVMLKFWGRHQKAGRTDILYVFLHRYVRYAFIFRQVILSP